MKSATLIALEVESTKLAWEQVEPESNNFDYAMKRVGKESTLEKLSTIAVETTSWITDRDIGE
ncbi:hypothetical protein ACI3E1_04120 [Ligilactobacillus sp. LYQ139]|uniref:hypothetical protein n=1 Tax=Ligilactobacillus sp. LYQ139 TaxID=3378800 RepID=UPI0038528ED6